MRLLTLLLLILLVVSCQQEPNKLDIYKQAKAADTQQLEEQFESTIATQKATENQKTVIYSATTKANLKALLATKDETNTNDSLANANEALQNIQHGALQINVRDYQDVYNRLQKLQQKLNFEIIAEQEVTTDYNRENTMTITASPAYFDEIMKECRSMATIIRKKYIWQPEENEDHLALQVTIENQKTALSELDGQLEKVKTTTDKLAIKEKIAALDNTLDLNIAKAQQLIEKKPMSTITLSMFQGIDIAKPTPAPFNASFSANLDKGWQNFKIFVLKAALVWPYILIGTIFLITILSAISSSRRRAQKFRMQALQQMNIQQQTAHNN